MRITFVLPFVELSGGGRVISIYAEKLKARGHDVFIVSQPAYGPSLRQKIKILLTGGGWPKPDKPGPFFDDLGIKHKVLEKCRSVKDKDVPDADVVIATFWFTAYWVDELSRSKGAKCYFVQGHEVQPYFYQSTGEETYVLPLHKIVVSRWLKTIMAEQYHDEDCDLVLNAVNLKQFTAVERPKNKDLTIGFIYSSKAIKRVEIAIAAVSQARKEITTIKAIAFGPELPEAPLELPDWIAFHHKPTQESIPTLYTKCDVWLSASEIEGFGLPILEAMACRTPVISSYAGAAPDLIKPNNGALVQLNVQAFVDEILRFNAMSSEEWGVFSENAFQTAHSYDWNDAADLFEQALLKQAEKT